MSIDALRREKIVAHEDHRVIADRFRAARQACVAVKDFPGAIPQSLNEAYAIQDIAIGAWPDTVAGWKVGRILGEAETKFGADRLIGPIFAQTIQTADGTKPTQFGAISGGFCAVEAEYVFVLGADAPTDASIMSNESALDLVAALHLGIEIAGSPLATINDLGPCVVVSDFGNNAGLILGPQIDDWRPKLGELSGQMSIDGTHVGEGGVHAFPGGIAQALSFAINTAGARGLPLKAGMMVSTGAVSGVHQIFAGQSAVATFGALGSMSCVCKML
jgi:2-keto-4-pentenoate hydratase